MATASSVSPTQRDITARTEFVMDQSLHDDAGQNASPGLAARESLQARLMRVVDLIQSGRPQEARLIAAMLYREQAGHVDVQQVYAISLARCGENEHAFALFEALLIQYGNHLYGPRIRSHYANALRDAGRWQEALQHYRRALAILPGDVPLLNGLGNTLRDLGRWDEAAEAFSAALDTNPDSAIILNNLGTCRQHTGDRIDARKCFEQALRLDANLADAWYNLGSLNQDDGAIANALRAYAEALSLAPRHLPAMSALTRLMQQSCEWEGLEWLQRQILEHVRENRPGAVFPFGFLAIEGSTSEDQFQCAERWRRQYYSPMLQASPPVSRRGSRNTDGRIRVGYLSSDFHEHATAHLSCEVFELHDRSRFEVIAYSAGPIQDNPTRRRIEAAFDRFVEVGSLSTLALAQQISDDGVDILVDMKGYTRNTRTGVLAMRPAPLQVSWLGYPGTLGAGLADYVISDAIVTPMSDAAYFGEKFAWMPHSYQCNDRQRPVAATPAKSACGLPENALILCCFNHAYKITPSRFAIWCEILKEVPDSVLWLLASSELTEQNLRNAAERHGIDADRLIFAKVVPPAEHRARITLADIFLDTVPYNAHTTCSDSLWAGVPVVTMNGKTFAGRVAHSLLAAVGLEELVAQSPEQYRALVLKLAREPAYRAQLRQMLAHKTALPLFDTPAFVNALESLYSQMWVRAKAGLPPTHLCCSGPVPSANQDSDIIGFDNACSPDQRNIA